MIELKSRFCFNISRCTLCGASKGKYQHVLGDQAEFFPSSYQGVYYGISLTPGQIFLCRSVQSSTEVVHSVNRANKRRGWCTNQENKTKRCLASTALEVKRSTTIIYTGESAHHLLFFYCSMFPYLLLVSLIAVLSTSNGNSLTWFRVSTLRHTWISIQWVEGKTHYSRTFSGFSMQFPFSYGKRKTSRSPVWFESLFSFFLSLPPQDN